MIDWDDERFLFLLEKYKRSDDGDKDLFKEEYHTLFPVNVKYSNPLDIGTCFSEEVTSSIDRNIILDLIWMNRTDILHRGLRKYKLKRILNGRKENS